MKLVRLNDYSLINVDRLDAIQLFYGDEPEVRVFVGGRREPFRVSGNDFIEALKSQGLLDED